MKETAYVILAIERRSLQLVSLSICNESWRSLTLNHNRCIYADFLSCSAASFDEAYSQLSTWIKERYPELYSLMGRSEGIW